MEFEIMDKRLDGKVVVITGASSGFGKGAALRFASMGANVVVAARREDLLQALVTDCESRGGKALAVATDVSNSADVRNLYEKTMERFGQLDVWINNAGAAAIGKFTEVPLCDHFQVIQTDLCGTIYGSHFAMKEFEKQGFGTLINVASMIARIPAPYYGSYAAAKHGVLGLSGSLRQELAEKDLKDIHVCTVLPMAMDTPFFEHAANYTGKEATPLPPVSDAEEVVDVFVDLVFHPKAEVAVGRGAGVFSVSDSVAPGPTETMMAKNTHRAQMVDAPDAAMTPGNLKHPTAQGSGVHGKKKR
jgi:short-subunit dehydrogenase